MVLAAGNKNEKGFTLIEIMITTIVVALVILGFVGATTSVQKVNQAAYERSVSFQDANRVVEQMRDAAASGTFPSNVTSSFSGAVSGFSSLTNQTVTVSYADASADPLDATVTVSYLENGTRAVSNSIRTFITQRDMADSSEEEEEDDDSGDDDDSDDGSDDGSDHGSDDDSGSDDHSS